MIKKIFLLSLVLFYSCSEAENLHIVDPVDMEFNIALEKWNNKAINSYTFDLSVSCYCMFESMPPWTIKVVNNKLKTIDGKDVNEQQLENEYWFALTIGELFTIIENKLSTNPFIYTSKYDSEYGFPVEIYFDMEEMMVDEEIGYWISSFKIN
jgi:hypothetical protein|tara:strand:+ start:498 stop:956 length:459 start_codon:yes stop_codon:yes gene_type:complete